MPLAQSSHPDTSIWWGLPSKIVQLKIEQLVHRGFGLARFQGKTIFIPSVLPGETVEAEIQREKTGFAYARLIRIIEPSRFRINPECPYFPACGGCQLAHIDYSHQITLKKEILRESLQRIGKFSSTEKILNPLPSSSPLRYRTRVKLHLDDGKIGFKGTNEQELVQIEDCLLICKELNASLPALKQLARKLVAGKERTIEMDYNPESKEIFASISPKREMIYQYLKGRFEMVSVPHKALLRLASFVQVNPQQNKNLQQIVSSLAESSGAKIALELFAGSGNLTFEIAKKIDSLVAVENNSYAIQLANLNMKESGIKNVQFQEQSAERYLNSALKSRMKFDLIILDPPRTGARKEVEKIIQLKPKTLIYVSCEPSTLARDLKSLINAGYQIEKIIPLDMFPQTYHIESISLLRPG